MSHLTFDSGFAGQPTTQCGTYVITERASEREKKRKIVITIKKLLTIIIKRVLYGYGIMWYNNVILSSEKGVNVGVGSLVGWQVEIGKIQQKVLLVCVSVYRVFGWEENCVRFVNRKFIVVKCHTSTTIITTTAHHQQDGAKKGLHV